MRGGGLQFKDGGSLKTGGSAGGRGGGLQQRGVMMMHGKTRGRSLRLSAAALSSLFYRSISDCASSPPSPRRFISPGRSPRGSSHLCLRSLPEQLSAFPASLLFLFSRCKPLNLWRFSHITSLCFQVMCASARRCSSLPVFRLLDHKKAEPFARAPSEFSKVFGIYTHVQKGVGGQETRGDERRGLA